MTHDESIVKAIRSTLIDFNEEKTHLLVRKGLNNGVSPFRLLESGLSVGMKDIGDKFGRGEIYLPELMRGAGIMKSSVDILTPAIKEAKDLSDKSEPYKIILGTVKGDIHDIGKNIVGIIFETAGYEVIDLGVDISANRFVNAIKEHKPNVIGLSALLTTTLPEMKKIIEKIKEEGIRDQIKIVVGGSSLTQEYANEIGADAYGIDAVDGLNKIKEMIS